MAPSFWKKFYFRPGNLRYPIFDLGFVKIGVYICYDRHFREAHTPWCWPAPRSFFNRSATVAGLSEHLWKLEQPSHAVANGYFIGAINRVGTEAPWKIGEFFGQSYFCDPRVAPGFPGLYQLNATLPTFLNTSGNLPPAIQTPQRLP